MMRECDSRVSTGICSRRHPRLVLVKEYSVTEIMHLWRQRFFRRLLEMPRNQKRLLDGAGRSWCAFPRRYGRQ
jgi:hypothetical protein